MKEQTLVLSVTHLNLHSCDNSKSFVIRINEQLCNRIKELSAHVASLGVDCIEEVCELGLWADTSYGESLEDGETHDDTMQYIMDSPNEISKTVLRVNKTEFLFYGIPQGCDERSKMLTTKFPIKKLDINTEFTTAGFY